MLSARKHLFSTTHGNYQIVMRIPTDLQPVLQTKWFKRSLKTSIDKDAEIILNGVLAKVQSSFVLLRAGMLSPEQITSVRDFMQPAKRVAAQHKTIKQLIDLYSSERSPNWTSPTKSSFEQKFLVMVQQLGDKDVMSYSREDFLAYRNKLLLSGLQPKTINTRLSLLSSLLKWGVRHGYLQQNHSEGMLLKADKAPDEQRKVYENDDLKRIVETLPQSSRCPWQYWVPLIAMHSGMRREEICQLRGSDIVSVDNIWCFRITADSKAGLKVKTESSARMVPIHQYLITKGLLDFTAEKLPVSNLWGFKRYKLTGDFGAKFGTWYSDFNREHITKDPLKCFHSFRHTFTNHLKQIGVQEVLIAELVGHSSDSITMSRYGKRFKVEVLLEVIQKVDYGI